MFLQKHTSLPYWSLILAKIDIASISKIVGYRILHNLICHLQKMIINSIIYIKTHYYTHVKMIFIPICWNMQLCECQKYEITAYVLNLQLLLLLLGQCHVTFFFWKTKQTDHFFVCFFVLLLTIRRNMIDNSTSYNAINQVSRLNSCVFASSINILLSLGALSRKLSVV